MNHTLVPASLQYKNVIDNLMQFYIYDFSEYLNIEVAANGLFEDYPHLEDYWKEAHHRFPYLVKKEEKYAGFVLVRYIETAHRNYFSIAEFFVMKKYRREGIGKAVAEEIFDLHKGQWEVYQKDSNKPAQLFWHKVIDEYTKGKFAERFKNGRLIQDFEN